MRICLLVSDLSWYGGTTRMATWLSGGLSHDHDVTILSLTHQNKDYFFPLDKKIQHIILPAFSGKAGILKQIRWIHRYIISNNIHRVINVDMGMGIYGVRAAKGTSCRVITWEHGNFCNNWGSRLFPHFRRYAAKKSHAVVLLTEKDRKNYENNYKKHAPIHVIPNPAERTDCAYDRESRTILSVGHLLRNKGYHRVVEMGRKILPSRPGWKWVICGEGPERPALEQAIRDAGLEQQILLPGLVKNMDEYYRTAAIQVLTSDMEGLPMTLLEGKGHSLPLVAFDIMTGPSDIIDDGINGYLIEPFDLDAMAEKIAALMDNPTLRKNYSENSKIGMEKFSKPTILQSWENLLKEV